MGASVLYGHISSFSKSSSIPIEKGGKNENDRVASPEVYPFTIKINDSIAEAGYCAPIFRAFLSLSLSLSLSLFLFLLLL